MLDGLALGRVAHQGSDSGCGIRYRNGPPNPIRIELFTRRKVDSNSQKKITKSATNTNIQQLEIQHPRIQLSHNSNPLFTNAP